MIPESCRSPFGCFQSQTVVADYHVGHALENRISDLHLRAGFTRHRSLEVRAHRFRRAPPHAAPLHDRDGVAEAAPVARGKARSDRRQIVTRHIGQDQPEHARSFAMAKQASAFHSRQMLAHGIQLANRRAGFQQGFVDRDLVGERETLGRPREHRRRASAKRDDHEVVGRRLMQHLARQQGGPLRRLIGDRMTRCNDPDFLFEY